MKNDRARVLVFQNWFVPGYKAGGPIRSIANVLNIDFEKIRFYVICNGFDIDKIRYKNKLLNRIIEYNSITKVLYVSHLLSSFLVLFNTIKIKPNVLYLNSIFSFNYCLLPLLLTKVNLIQPYKIILVPRGASSSPALNRRSFRKNLYLKFAKLLLSTDMIVQYANLDEFNSSVLFENLKHVILSNVPALPSESIVYKNKNSKSVNLLSVGRIHPIKNQLQVLKVLAKSKFEGEIRFTILGMIDDEDYWEKCKTVISTLPSNIQVNYLMPMPHNRVEKVLVDCHFFIQLSRSESFGHSIFEALTKGKPIVVSNNTPWKRLQEKGIGWDLDTAEDIYIIDVISKLLDMDNSEYLALCKSSYQYSKDFINKTNYKLDYEKLYAYES